MRALLVAAALAASFAHGAVPRADVGAEPTAEPPEATVAEVASETAAEPRVEPLAEVPSAERTEAAPIPADSQFPEPGEVSLAAVPPSAGEEAHVRALAAATASDVCGIADMFVRERMLSAPWSVSRRLRAARIRGDEDEARRLGTMLEEVVLKALSAEPPGEGR